MTNTVYFWLEPQTLSGPSGITSSYICHLSASKLDDNYTGWEVKEDFPVWLNNKILYFKIENAIQPQYMIGWFSGAKSFITEPSKAYVIGLDLIDTSACLSMAHLFENVSWTEWSPNISTWDVSNVVDMNHMFANATDVHIDLSGWDVSNVKDTSYMFSDFVGEFKFGHDFTSLENIAGMFNNAGGRWYESDLESIKNILPLIPSNNLKELQFAFNYNPSSELDLIHWENTSTFTNVTAMFQNTPNLRMIKAFDEEDWNLDNVIIKDSTMADNMFQGATKLVGGHGTKYDGSRVGKEFAKIDNGPTSTKPGYFTPFIIIPWFNVFTLDTSVVYDGNNHGVKVRVETMDDLFDDILVSSGTDTTYSELVDANLDPTTHMVTLLPDTYINAGEYTIYYKVVSANHESSSGSHEIADSIVLYINKANIPAGAYTLPTGVSGLIYNTSEQAMVENGATTVGQVLYSIDGGTTWSTNIPKYTNAGTYSIMVKVGGDPNYNDIEPITITVEIAKADIDSSLYTAPVANTLVYNGNAQAMVTAGTSTVNPVKYSQNSEGPFSTVIPSATNAGDYKVWYMIDGNSNYNDLDPIPVTVTIDKANSLVIIAPVPIDDILFDNSEHGLLLSMGSESGGTLMYSFTDSQGTLESEWFTEMPKATNPGAYKIYYKVFGDSNHKDTVVSMINAYIRALQHKTVYSKKTSQNVDFDSEYVGLSQVTILWNSEGYVVPAGTLLVTSEGTDIDVAAWEKVDLRLATELPRRMVEKLFTSYTISEGIKKIGSYAFQNADQLTEITIPHWITYMGAQTFKGDISLTAVTYEPSSEGLNYTGSYAFEDCTALTTVNLPDNITNISSYTFQNTKSLATVDLPDTLTEIGDSAFNNRNYDGQGLQSIILPNSLTKIGSNAFAYTNLETIVIPNSVTSMGSYTFYYCKNLKNVTWPANITVIPMSTFNRCESLVDTSWIPNTVTEIGSDAFNSCLNIEHIDLSNITKIGTDAFYHCDKLKELDFSENMTEIGESICRYHQDLEYIHIPSGVTSIGKRAFYTFTFEKTDNTPKVLTMVIDAVTPPTIPVQSTATGTNNQENILVGYSYLTQAVAQGWRIYVPDEAYDAYVDPSCNWYFYKDLIHKKSEMPANWGQVIGHNIDGTHLVGRNPGVLEKD